MSNEKYKTLKNNTIIFTIGNIGSSLISFLLLPIFTNFLNAEEYGNIDLISISVTLFMPIFILNFTEVLIRFGLDKNYKIEKVISTVFITNIIIFIPIIIIIGAMNFYLEGKLIYLLFLFILLSINGLYELIKHYCRAIEKLSLYAFGDILYTVLFCFFNIYFIVYREMGIYGYFSGYIISQLIYILYISILTNIRQYLSFSFFSKSYLYDFLKYGIPLIPNSISFWIVNTSDRYIIKYFLGSAPLGIYSVANKIPQIITTLYSIFYKAWQISSIKEIKSEEVNKFYSQIFDILVKLMFLLCLSIILFIHFIMFLFIGSEFKYALYLIPILLLSTVFYTFTSFMSTIYLAHKRSKDVMKSTLLAAILNIILNLVFIGNYGVIAASITTLISYIFLFVYRYYNSKNLIHIKVNWINMIMFLLITFAMIYNIYTLNSEILLFFINLLLYSVFLYINRKDIYYLKNNLIKIYRKES